MVSMLIVKHGGESVMIWGYLSHCAGGNLCVQYATFMNCFVIVGRYLSRNLTSEMFDHQKLALFFT